MVNKETLIKETILDAIKFRFQYTLGCGSYMINHLNIDVDTINEIVLNIETYILGK